MGADDTHPGIVRSGHCDVTKRPVSNDWEETLHPIRRRVVGGPEADVRIARQNKGHEAVANPAQVLSGPLWVTGSGEGVEVNLDL